MLPGAAPGLTGVPGQPDGPGGPDPEPPERSDVLALVPAERLLPYVDAPPLAPEEPDGADRGPLLPLELLAWSDEGELVGVRCTRGAVVLRAGRPAVRRPLAVRRITRWARAGRVTLHCADGDVELRLLDPGEYAGLSLGDRRESRVPGPLRIARSGRRADQRDEVAGTLVTRVLRVDPEVQVGND